MSCSGVTTTRILTNTGSRILATTYNAVTGYISCTATSTLSDVTAALWMRSANSAGGISNLVCDTGYY